MKNNFKCKNWEQYIPVPVYEEHPELFAFYKKAWELAYDHIKEIDGMPQTPYMDESFCETQLWIWDSCFMALFTKYAREVFPGVETLNNFYEVLYKGKRLPKIMPPENEPDWTGAIFGNPYEMKIHISDNPPLFAWTEYENALISGNINYLKKLLYEDKYLQKHFEWIENLRDSVLLDGFLNCTCLKAEKDGYKWEGGRSGMDNTPRGRLGKHAVEERPNNPDLLWIDILCQQALSAKIISKMFALLKDKEEEEKWNCLYLEKKKIINSLYWDDKDKFYYDIDCNTHEFCKVMTIASFWALTAEVASEEQAEHLKNQLLNPDTFGGDFPLVSLSRNDADYNPEGQYWRGSVWLPTAYATLKGLANYGYFEEARELSYKLLCHMYKTYTDFEPHTIWECYSPEEFKPGTIASGSGDCVRPDFCGWSALGPISIYIEFVLGFHKIDAFTKTVEWAKPDEVRDRIGIKNLRFASVVTDIEAMGNNLKVKSNEPYILKISGREYNILSGENDFII